MKDLFFYFRCNVLYFLFSSCLGNASAQITHRTGAIFDSVSYNKIETVSPALRFNDNYPTVFSLKEYCPKPGNQGNLGTCTAWATGYAAMTISYAIQNNIIQKDIITENARSAMYLFKKQDLLFGSPNCERGALIGNILETGKNFGDCEIVDFNPTDCSVNPDKKLDERAIQCKIRECNTLFLFPSFKNYNQKLSAVINSISSKKPVVVGLSLYTSFDILKKEEIYAPKTSEKKLGEHAVCLIGYDNNLRQFEFINSWGEDWGNGGFFKMSYDDFFRDCTEAYQFSLIKKTNTEEVLRGSVQLLKFTEINNNTGWPEFITASARKIKNGIYSLTDKVKQDDFFRLKVNNVTPESYLYILTLKPNHKVEILFPLSYSAKKASGVLDIPFITSSNASIELPEDPNNGYTADEKGEDIMCILFSKKRINNLDILIKDLEKSRDIFSWIKKSFGADLINPEYVDYKVGEMYFSSKSYSKGSIVPVILKVNVK